MAGLKYAPPPDPYQVRPSGVRVLDRQGMLLRGFLSPDQKRRWQLQLSEISPELIQAVLHHEDRWFHRHRGVNPLAVLRAFYGNLRAGKVTSGASTLTMQLARLTEPKPRTWSAKIHQAWRALQYESLYSKDEILIRYLNLAPYGGNLEGVGAASWALFQKPAAELSWSEACLLAVIPQSPNGHNPVRNPQEAGLARDNLAQSLLVDGLVDGVIHQEILTSPLPEKWYKMPFKAPHFTRWTLQRHPGQPTLKTTLDARMQDRSQRIISDRIRQLRTLGITQGAAVILDSRTGEIRAMVGSAHFSDLKNQGKVNGAIAPRSPGSTLKPFVYALAMDRGLTTSDALLEDVPRWFADYSPKNYDGTFSGFVKTSSALQKSLNVPAVALAAELEHTQGGGLHQFLVDSHIASVNKPSGHYGLTLVLGGGEITLLELASLYGMLARQGLWLPTRDLPAGADTMLASKGRRMLGAGASWMIMNELTGVNRPDEEIKWQGTSDRFEVPWKTGTSYGHRDAWSVGIAGPWVVAVWVGNFSGEGSPHLSGAEVAAPLFFDLIEELNLNEKSQWKRRPETVSEHQICALSGMRTNGLCEQTTQGYYLPGISPETPCSIHRRIELHGSTGQTVCSRCRSDEPSRYETVEWWPALGASYMAASGLTLPAIPEHKQDCPAFGMGSAPTITSPQRDSEYFLRPAVPLHEQSIALQATSSSGTTQLWWFVDGSLLRKVKPGETVFYTPSVGRHQFTVLDNSGRSGSLSVRIHGND